MIDDTEIKLYVELMNNNDRQNKIEGDFNIRNEKKKERLEIMWT